jgi:hypothetical protein
MAIATPTITSAPTSARTRWRVAQTAVFWVTIALLATVPVGFFAQRWFSASAVLAADVEISLTPAAWTAYTIGLGVLLLACVGSHLMRPRGGLVVAVLVLLLVNVPFMLTDPARLAIVAVGSLSLLFASIVGAGRRPGGVVAVAIVFSFAPCLIAGGLLFINLVGRDLLGGEPLTETADYVHAPSPDGRWLLVAEHYRTGAWGSDSCTVWIERDLLGVLRIRRTLYVGDGDQPRVRWLDAKTITVGGVPISVSAGTTTYGNY